MYKFPIIKTIDDILPVIENDHHFTIKENDHFITILYNKVGYPFSSMLGMDEDEKPKEAIRRECRGIKFFGKSYPWYKKIAQRPFHKFMNLDEMSEVFEGNIDWAVPYKVENKLDGSMICPIYMENTVRFTTKSGITEVSLQAEDYLRRNKLLSIYQNFCWQSINSYNSTPIFEYTSPMNQIVLRYPEEKLTLLAIRDNETGYYQKTVNEGNEDLFWPIPIIKTAKWPIEQKEDNEGVVISFDNGLKVKVKTEWYIQRHRSKDHVVNGGNVFEFIFNGSLDDVLAFVIEPYHSLLKDYASILYECHDTQCNNFMAVMEDFLNEHGVDPKTFALDYLHTIPSYFKGLAFEVIRGKELTRENIDKAFVNIAANKKYMTHICDEFDVPSWKEYMRMNHG